MATALQDEQQAAARIRSITAADRRELDQLEVQAASTGSELTDLKMDARDQRARLLATLNDRRDDEDASRWFSTSDAERKIRVAIAELEASGDVSAEAMAEIDKLTAAKNALAGELAANEAFAQQLTDFDSPTAVTGPNGWRKTAVQLLRGEITYDSSNPTHQEAMRKIGEDNMARTASDYHASLNHQNNVELENAAHQAAGEQLLLKIQAARDSGNQPAIRMAMTVLATSMLERGNNQALQIANSVAIQTNERLGVLRQTHQSTMQSVIATSQDQHIGADGGIDYIYGSDRTKLISAGDIRGMAAFLSNENEYVAEIKANYRAASGPHAGQRLDAKVIDGVGVVVRVAGTQDQWEAIHDDGMFDAQHTIGAVLPMAIEVGAAMVGWGLKIAGVAAFGAGVVAFGASVIAAPFTGGLSLGAGLAALGAGSAALASSMAIAGGLSAGAELLTQGVGMGLGYRTGAGDTSRVNVGSLGLAFAAGAAFPGAGAVLKRIGRRFPIADRISSGLEGLARGAARRVGLGRTQADGTFVPNRAGAAIVSVGDSVGAFTGRVGNDLTRPSENRFRRNLTLNYAYKLRQQNRMRDIGRSIDSADNVSLDAIKAQLKKGTWGKDDNTSIFGSADEIQDMSASELWKRWSSVMEKHGDWLAPSESSGAYAGYVKLNNQLWAMDAIQQAIEKEVKFTSGTPNFRALDMDPKSPEAIRYVRHVSHRHRMEAIREAGREVNGNPDKYVKRSEDVKGGGSKSESAQWTWVPGEGEGVLQLVSLTQRQMHGQGLNGVSADKYRELVVDQAQKLYDEISNGKAFEFVTKDGELPEIFNTSGLQTARLTNAVQLARVGDQFHDKLRKEISTKLGQDADYRIDSEGLSEMLMSNQDLFESVKSLNLPTSNRVQKSDLTDGLTVPERRQSLDYLSELDDYDNAVIGRVNDRLRELGNALGIEGDDITVASVRNRINELRFGSDEFGGRKLATMSETEIVAASKQFSEDSLLPLRDEGMVFLNNLDSYVDSLDSLTNDLQISISGRASSGVAKDVTAAVQRDAEAVQRVTGVLRTRVQGEGQVATRNQAGIIHTWVSKEVDDTLGAVIDQMKKDDPMKGPLIELRDNRDLMEELEGIANAEWARLSSNDELFSSVALAGDSNYVPGFPILSKDGFNRFAEQLAASTSDNSLIRERLAEAVLGVLDQS